MKEIKEFIGSIQMIIVVSLQEILDKIYQILAHPPACQSAFSSATERPIAQRIGMIIDE